MEENEVKKIKQLFRKGVALALAAVTTLSVLPAVTVSAASQRATITFAYCYDGNGNTIRYQQTASHNGITFSHAGEARTRIYADGDNAYCIEPGISLHTGNTLEKDASVVWNNLGKAKQDAVNLALLYGAQGSMGSLSGTEDEKVLATQMVIWEIVTGCRNASAPYAQTDAKFYNSLCVDGANSGIAAAYQQIISGMVSHGTIPSFASGSTDSTPQELKWDGKQYVLKLTDSNGVLSKFNFTSSNSDVKVSKSGNTLTIMSSKAIAGNVQLSATKKIPTVSSSAKLIAYGDPSLQDIVTGVENTAAVKAYLNVKIPYGHIQIVKTSEDGVVAGLKFQITGNGIDQTVTTGEDGTIKVENLQPGTYTVTELTENRYEPQKAQTVEVKGGETAAVDFSNILKRGGLKVTKTSEDGLVEGMKFHLYGTSLSGIPVDEYAVTDSAGVAMFSDILISGDTPYTLEEVVARNYLITERPDAILNIVDGTNLERNLYLTTQLMELGIPVLMAVNMMDIVQKNGDQININALSKKLGCPVVEISALKGSGIMEAANKAVELARGGQKVSSVHRFGSDVESVLEEIAGCLGNEIPEEQKRFYAIKLFERDDKIAAHMTMVPDVERLIKGTEDAMV